MCANGRKKAAPTLHAVASSWSSCVKLPIQRLFLGISAALNLIVYGADAIDAYAHSPASDAKTYLSVDNAYEEWWNLTAKETNLLSPERLFYRLDTACKVTQEVELCGCVSLMISL